MLSVFPDLLTFALVAPTILRLFLGASFLYLGFRALTREKGEILSLYKNMGFGSSPHLVTFYGVVETILGLLLIVGLFTQIAALFTGIISLKWMVFKRLGRDFGREGYLFYFLVFGISVSLLFAGPGFLAFDLPL